MDAENPFRGDATADVTDRSPSAERQTNDPDDLLFSVVRDASGGGGGSGGGRAGTDCPDSFRDTYPSSRTSPQLKDGSSGEELKKEGVKPKSELRFPFPSASGEDIFMKDRSAYWSKFFKLRIKKIENDETKVEISGDGGQSGRSSVCLPVPKTDHRCIVLGRLKGRCRKPTVQMVYEAYKAIIETVETVEPRALQDFRKFFEEYRCAFNVKNQLVKEITKFLRIGPNPATVPEISPSRSFPRDFGGSSSGANQRQLSWMTPIPLSPGAQPSASDGIPFPPGQDMKGQGGMLSF